LAIVAGIQAAAKEAIVMLDARELNKQHASLLALYVSKVLHGIGTPLASSTNWRDTQWWSRHKDFEFLSLLQVVTDALQDG